MDKNSLIQKIVKSYLFLRLQVSKILRIWLKHKISAITIGILVILLILFLVFKNQLFSYTQLNQLTYQSSDSATIESGLEELNRQTPIELSYHSDVRDIINLYKNERRSELESMIAYSRIYFPIIEPYLDKYNLPIEIKYLVAVESGFNPHAKSKSGATGLWQLLYSSCDLLDLSVTSYIDERKDIFKSTDAACRYLSYLYRIFNDWNLAIAAYNGGPGAIKKAIERSGGKTDFWEIRSFLPRETANYVPKFIAFNYLFANFNKRNIEVPEDAYSFNDADSIRINQPIWFSQISEELEISEKQIAFLNPIYKSGYIPATENGCILVLPKDKIIDFIRNEDNIYKKKIVRLTYLDLIKDSASVDNRMCVDYIVLHGDFCHKLAMKYDCTVENIMAWNNLEDGSLYPGQHLNIWVKE